MKRSGDQGGVTAPSCFSASLLPRQEQSGTTRQDNKEGKEKEKSTDGNVFSNESDQQLGCIDDTVEDSGGQCCVHALVKTLFMVRGVVACVTPSDTSQR